MEQRVVEGSDHGDRVNWKLLAWPISGFVIGLIVFGGFTLYAIYHRAM